MSRCQYNSYGKALNLCSHFISDLQFSSEEELDEVPLNEFEDSKGGILIPAEMADPGADDDSQQAAEAMVQLGTMGYYHQTEADVNETLIFKGR